MLIVYNPKTGAILGHCGQIFHNGVWREPTLEEIFPDQDRSQVDTLYLKDDARFLVYGPENWRISRDSSGVVTGLERLPVITLSCDAGDRDKDGIPDLPADGTSTTKITAKIEAGAAVDITFRTTRGSLSQRTVHATGDKPAVVELRAASETVAVTVTASAPGYRQATLQLEFIPAK